MNEHNPTSIDGFQPNMMSDEQLNALLANALKQLIAGNDLDEFGMSQVMSIIMQGKCPDALMGAILTALRIKGESVDEFTAAVKIMLNLADRVHLPENLIAVDIVGTGGDGANLFNVSTASIFVAAAAGVIIAKHGSRGVSTISGASDLLSLMGVNLNLNTKAIERCITEFGMGFMFAPNHHPAMRHAAGVRALLKTRTLFNIIGPLTNPAQVRHTVLGVYDAALCRPIALVLAKLGFEHALVMNAQDGLDEFSLAAPTQVSELKDGTVIDYLITPEDVGLTTQSLSGLTVENPAQSLELIRLALANSPDTIDARIQKAQDLIALNAGAAIYVSGRAISLANGVNMAQTIIQSGEALTKLERYAQFTQSLDTLSI